MTVHYCAKSGQPRTVLWNTLGPLVGLDSLGANNELKFLGIVQATGHSLFFPLIDALLILTQLLRRKTRSSACGQGRIETGTKTSLALDHPVRNYTLPPAYPANPHYSFVMQR